MNNVIQLNTVIDFSKFKNSLNMQGLKVFIGPLSNPKKFTT